MKCPCSCKYFKIFRIFGIRKPIYGIFPLKSISNKIKYHQVKNDNEHGFLYSKIMTNLEAFRWNISSDINFLFLNK